MRNHAEVFAFHPSGEIKIWELNPMNRADEFREKADQCRRLAVRAAKTMDKERWLSLAEHWLLMAQHEEERGERS